MTSTPDGLDYLRARALPVPTREAELAMVVAAQRGDKQALDRLVRSSIRLAISVSTRYVRRGMGSEQLGDLVQHALDALIRAVKDFDPAKGSRFSSYACWWMRAYTRRYALGQRSIVARPIRDGVWHATPGDASLDATRPGVEDETWLDALPAPDAGAEVQVARSRHAADVRARLREHRTALGKVGMDIAERRLAGGHTLEEIGRRHGLCRERVRQIEREVLEYLRRVFADLRVAL